MYCIKCGVELADSEKVCPLCGTVCSTPICLRAGREPVSAGCQPPCRGREPRGRAVRAAVLFLLPAVISVLCDWRINGSIVWSGYASGGVALLYVLVALPLWFRRPNPVIFVPIDFAAIGLYLLYINCAPTATGS